MAAMNVYEVVLGEDAHVPIYIQSLVDTEAPGSADAVTDGDTLLFYLYRPDEVDVFNIGGGLVTDWFTLSVYSPPGTLLVNSGVHMVTVPASAFTVPGMYVLFTDATIFGNINDYPNAFVMPVAIRAVGKADSQIGRVLAAPSSSVIQVSDFWNSDGDDHWKDNRLRFTSGNLKFQQRKISGSVQKVRAYGGAAYIHSTLTIDATGAFTNLPSGEADGTVLYLSNTPTLGGSITPGYYTIDSKVDNDKVILKAAAGAGNSGGVTLGGVTELTFLTPFTSAPAQNDRVCVIAE